MNPHTTVRPWVLAIAKQYGISEAHDYKYADADTRQDDQYIEYRMVSCYPYENGVHDNTSSSGYTAHRSAFQEWKTMVWVDIWDSEDGMYELASMAVAALHNQQIKAIFRAHGATFVRAERIDNLSEFDDEEIRYHHRMICEFRENVEYDLDETNAIVEEIQAQLNDEHANYSITDSGVEEI